MSAKFARQLTGASLAKPNSIDADLLAAARHSPCAKIKAALAAGASLEAFNEQGENTVLMASARRNNTSIARFVCSLEVDLAVYDDKCRSTLHGFAHAGATDLMKLSIDAGCGVDDVCRLGSIPLGLAALSGNPKAVSLLLVAGASVNGRPNAAAPPIHSADGLVLDVLLAGGADIDGRTSWQRTPLMRAASEGRTELCQRLLDSGANVDLCDSDNMTALLLAASRGHGDCLLVMLEAGADRHVVSNRGDLSDLIGEHDAVRMSFETWKSRQAMASVITRARS